MSTKEKAVNYSDENVAFLKANYVGADNAAEVKSLAVALGKSEGSIRGKLSSMKIYVTAAKAPGSTRVTKANLVTDIGRLVGGFSEAESDGLTKATSVPLAKILARLTIVAAAESDEG